MTKHISQREARRLKRLVEFQEKELRNLRYDGDLARESRHISTWTTLPASLFEEVRILTRAGFRVEIRCEEPYPTKLTTWAVRRKLP